MSNLIKAKSILYGGNSQMVIDANQSRLIKELEERIQEQNQEGASKEADGFVTGIKIHDYIKEEQIHLEEEKEALQRATREEAKALLEEARIQAEALARDAFEEAKQKGYQEGYQSGQEAALSEIRQQQEVQETELRRAKEQLEQEQEACLVQTAEKVAAMITKLVAKLTGIVAKGQQNVILYLLNQALKETENSRNFLIRVSEEDYAYVEEHWEDLYGANHPGITLTLFADGKLTHNQCLIESESGLSDCSLDVQLEELMDCLALLEEGR